MTSASHLDQWLRLRSSEPRLRAIDIADKLGIREGELVQSAVGASGGELSAIRLAGPFADILRGFSKLGPMKAITRNRHAVSEMIGTYPPVEVMGSMGQTVGEIDLRIFFRHWAHAYAFTEKTSRGPRHSIQFFCRSGIAIHKAYATEETDMDAFDALVGAHVHPDPEATLGLEAPASSTFGRPDADVDAAALRESWLSMKDTHDFYPLLQRLEIDRLQALRLAGRDLARPVARDVAEQLLRTAAEDGVPIMVFVANPALVQIRLGRIHKVAPLHGWLNILDPEFNLHMLPDSVASAWVVKKPTPDDTVTSVELYDDKGEQVVTFFGERHEGQKELSGWRNIVDSLPDAAT